VAIVEISESAFALLPQIQSCRTHWAKERERAWFADSSGRVAGTLLHDPQTELWSYSICRQGDDGQYVRVAYAADFTDAGMARRDLIARMRETA
jgi:hypothetical protein